MKDTDEAKPGGLRNMAPWVWRRGQIVQGSWSLSWGNWETVKHLRRKPTRSDSNLLTERGVNGVKSRGRETREGATATVSATDDDVFNQGGANGDGEKWAAPGTLGSGIRRGWWQRITVLHKREHGEERGRMLIKDQFILLLNPPGVPLPLALSPRYMEMTVRRGAGQAPT